jgi:uncharacterized membrane protein YtjA (UPF0391 family)
MLRLAILFLVIALVAALFGFGLVVNTAVFAAKVMFFVFIVLFLVSLIAGGAAGGYWGSRRNSI